MKTHRMASGAYQLRTLPCILLVWGLAGCGGRPQHTIVGEWEYAGDAQSGQPGTIQRYEGEPPPNRIFQPDEKSPQKTFVFGKDGTFKVTTPSGTQEGNYTLDGEGKTMSVTVTDAKGAQHSEEIGILSLGQHEVTLNLAFYTHDSQSAGWLKAKIAQRFRRKS